MSQTLFRSQQLITFFDQPDPIITLFQTFIKTQLEHSNRLLNNPLFNKPIHHLIHRTIIIIYSDPIDINVPVHHCFNDLIIPLITITNPNHHISYSMVTVRPIYHSYQIYLIIYSGERLRPIQIDVYSVSFVLILVVFYLLLVIIQLIMIIDPNLIFITFL